MLMGAMPFGTTASDSWRRRVLAGDFTPLKAHIADPPSGWHDFFAGCFSVDRSKRPRSATDLLRELERAAG